MTQQKPKHQRIIIVTDGYRWFVRRLSTITHDIGEDEKLYRCDMPIGGACETLDNAVVQAKAYLDNGESTAPRLDTQEG